MPPSGVDECTSHCGSDAPGRDDGHHHGRNRARPPARRGHRPRRGVCSHPPAGPAGAVAPGNSSRAGRQTADGCWPSPRRRRAPRPAAPAGRVCSARRRRFRAIRMPKRATSKLIHHHDPLGSAYTGAPTSTPVRYAGRLPAARSSGAAGCGPLRTAWLTGIRFAIPVEGARGASRAAAGGCVGRTRPARGAVHGREGGRRAVVCDGSGADPPSPTPTEPVSASPRRLPLTSSEPAAPCYAGGR